MVRIAALHETMPSVLQYASEERMQGLEVVHATAHAPEFLKGLRGHSVDALLLSLDLLGDDPVRAIDRIIKDVQPKVTVVVYAFTRSSILRELGQRDGVQVVRAPITLEALRTQLIHSAADSSDGAAQVGGAAAAPRQPVSQVVNQEAPARVYSDYQLANLQQIRSTVDCECPNQVADVLISLNGFEDYSRQCENKNDEDARVHAMLARASGQARAIMEEAMKRLCRHEGIEIDRHGNTRMDLMHGSSNG